MNLYCSRGKSKFRQVGSESDPRVEGCNGNLQGPYAKKRDKQEQKKETKYPLIHV